MTAWIVEAWRYVALSPRSQWRQLQALRALDARLLRDVGISRIEAVVGRPLDMLDRPDRTGSGNMDNIRAAAAHVRVRDSMDADVSAIQRIYGHHVLHGAASFEEEPPSIEEMARRRHDVLQRGLPYLVAERDGKVVGYCYAGLYRTRAAYRHTVENSVYIDKDWHGHGIGRALLAELLARCAAGGCRRVVAIIGDNSAASVALHRSQGFRMVGVLERVGFKFGRWIDTTLMQRDLDGGTAMDGAEPGR